MMSKTALDLAVMNRLRAPFGCEFIAKEPDPASGREPDPLDGRWRISDANDDAIASVNGRERGLRPPHRRGAEPSPSIQDSVKNEVRFQIPAFSLRKEIIDDLCENNPVLRRRLNQRMTTIEFRHAVMLGTQHQYDEAICCEAWSKNFAMVMTDCSSIMEVLRTSLEHVKVALTAPSEDEPHDDA